MKVQNARQASLMDPCCAGPFVVGRPLNFIQSGIIKRDGPVTIYRRKSPTTSHLTIIYPSFLQPTLKPYLCAPFIVTSFWVVRHQNIQKTLKYIIIQETTKRLTRQSIYFPLMSTFILCTEGSEYVSTKNQQRLIYIPLGRHCTIEFIRTPSYRLQLTGTR